MRTISSAILTVSLDHVQRSAKRRDCLLSYSQAQPGRELTQPSPCLLAEPCNVQGITKETFPGLVS